MIAHSEAKIIAQSVNAIFWNPSNQRSISDIVNEVLNHWKTSNTNEEVCLILNYIVAANNYEEPANHVSFRGGRGGRTGFSGDDIDGSDDNWSNVVRSYEECNI